MLKLTDGGLMLDPNEQRRLDALMDEAICGKGTTDPDQVYAGSLVLSPDQVRQAAALLEPMNVQQVLNVIARVKDPRQWPYFKLIGQICERIEVHDRREVNSRDSFP